MECTVEGTNKKQLIKYQLLFVNYFILQPAA